MKRNLLIFGANGALGKGVTGCFIKKNYSKIFLFDPGIENEKDENKSIFKIKVNNLVKEENVAEAFKNIKSDKDELYFLYSTVGGFAGGKNLWDMDVDEWDKMININLKTGFLIAKYFSKIVADSAGGSICFTAAYTGLYPESGKSAYGVSKSALIHLVKSLAIEGEKINLSVNAIAPFIIDTEANRKWMKKDDYSTWIKPDEIGELAHNIFENFYFITGNIISLTKRFNIK
jgi:NAD(P)-dependent dehydrogenase (short-subunit alcohol dehydrogenase family)